jgi:integrase
LVAADFLRMLGRLAPDPVPAPGRYEAHVEDFIAAQRQRGWLSEASCRTGRWQVVKFLAHLDNQAVSLESLCPTHVGRTGRWQVVKFLAHLDNQAVSLESLCPTHVDTYFQHQAQRWARASLHTASKILRAWFRHCEDRGWVQPGLAASILLPRLYRDEGLPPGPTWDQIARVLAEATGHEPARVRDHAIVLLLAVYGLRSGELLRLCLEDIDWQHDRLRVVRSKSLREERLPLDPAVGNALARYLRHGRPRSASRSVFLTLRAPYRALSVQGLYGVVARRLARVGAPHKGRGPHGLRHACARHLREAGLSFKQIGDHLGHRSPDATRLYAKVDLASLRLVAFEDLGGLT